MERNRRLQLLRAYVRDKAPGLVPDVSETLAASFQGMGDALGFDIPQGMGGGLLNSLFHLPEGENGFWFAPSYHHRGILPFRDVLEVRIGMRNHLLNERLQFDARPFYGQRWLGGRNYWGTELGINLKHRESSESGGRIALRYTNGDATLMNRAGGFDMHTEIRFDNNLSLHAGVRQQENTDMGDYVLLRWKLDLGR